MSIPHKIFIARKRSKICNTCDIDANQILHQMRYDSVYSTNMRHLRRAKYRDETILTWQMAQICLSVFVKEFILSFFLTVPHEIDMEVIKRLLYRYSASEQKMHYELHSAL